MVWEADAPSAARLISVSLPAPAVSPLAFLRQGRGRERVYWADPLTRVTWVGRGVAADLTAWGDGRFQSIEAQARRLFADAYSDAPHPDAAPRLFGGFAFRDDFIPDNTWAGYPAAQFVLPHFQLSRSPAGSWLTVNVLASADEDAAATAEQLRAVLADVLADWDPTEPAERTNSLIDVRYPLSRAAWDALIRNATAAIQAGELEKVVLSRVCELRFSDNVEADRVLDYLDAVYASCYRFLFEPQPWNAFLGATPELLAQVAGDRLTTMAMAGSARRGRSVADDLQIGNELLYSDKNRREHQIVVDAIAERLAPLTTDLTWPETPHLRKLHNIQHLCTPMTGALRRPTSVLEPVALLHPTPALGGAPRAQALAYIGRVEEAPRGWYAAPVGVLDAQMQGTFAVAIRSAVTQYRRVWLHAGCGIVAGSDPQAEWEETALKFRPMLDAFAPDRPGGWAEEPTVNPTAP